MVELTVEHCKEVLGCNLVIGSADAQDGLRKRFVFNPLFNEYRIYHGGIVYDRGQAVEELLDIYNDL